MCYMWFCMTVLMKYEIFSINKSRNFGFSIIIKFNGKIEGKSVGSSLQKI